MLHITKVLVKGSVKVTLYCNNEIQINEANEGATITAKNIEQPSLEVRGEEGAYINLVVKTKLLKVESISGAVVKLSGSTESQIVDVDLGATHHGFNVKVVGFCKVKSGSGSKAEVFAGKTLDAEVSFRGTIFYKGIPKNNNEKKSYRRNHRTTKLKIYYLCYIKLDSYVTNYIFTRYAKPRFLGFNHFGYFNTLWWKKNTRTNERIRNRY